MARTVSANCRCLKGIKVMRSLKIDENEEKQQKGSLMRTE